MDAELKERWITALTDGSFKRARGKLKDGNGYCCLGVVCKLAGETVSDMGIYSEGEWHKSYPPARLNDALGLTDHYLRLAGYNDEAAPGDEFPDTVIKYIKERL